MSSLHTENLIPLQNAAGDAFGAVVTAAAAASIPTFPLAGKVSFTAITTDAVIAVVPTGQVLTLTLLNGYRIPAGQERVFQLDGPGGKFDFHYISTGAGLLYFCPV